MVLAKFSNKVGKTTSQVSQESSHINIETIWSKIIVTSYTWDRECHGLFDFDL